MVKLFRNFRVKSLLCSNTNHDKAAPNKPICRINCSHIDVVDENVHDYEINDIDEAVDQVVHVIAREKPQLISVKVSRFALAPL